MTEDPRTVMEQATQARERAMTPEKMQRRKEVDERNARIQTVGVKAPVSGT